MKKKINLLIIVCVLSMSMISGCAGIGENIKDRSHQDSTALTDENISIGENEETSEIKGYMRKSYIAAGNFSYAITNDGKVLSAGKSEGINSFGGYTQMPDVSGWNNIKCIDSSVYSVCAVSKSGIPVGDGMENDTGESALSKYTDCRQVVTDGQSFYILNNSGTVKMVGIKQDAWQEMLKLSSGVVFMDIAGGHMVLLKNDGKVTAYGQNTYGENNVNEWEDIVDIACGEDYTIGLKSDGTVVAVGNNNKGQCDVSEWTDIIQIATGNTSTLGLKSDGTIVYTGDNKYGQCNVSDWTDIVAVESGIRYTIGIKSDGTAIATGDNRYGQCDVLGWSNIKVINR